MILRDENAIVLDFLPRGHSTGRQEPLAQVIGKKYFSLLELVVKKDVVLKPSDETYIGDARRDQIDHIKRRITIKDLTNFAKMELEAIVSKLVDENEQKFVDFFNKAEAINTRLHQLELLPGFGRKHTEAILETRKDKAFKGFEDIKKRIPNLPDPKKAIEKRLLQEIENVERHSLFVR